MPATKNKPAVRKTLPKKPPSPKAVEQEPTTPEETVATQAALHPVSIANVPDKALVNKYISRSFPIGGGKDWSDMQVFDYSYEQGLNVLIEGPTGPGKTMATLTWAAMRNKRVARIPSNAGIDASQLFGKYIPDEVNGGFTWQMGPVPDVFLHGGVILWNEINFTPERIGSVMFGALDANREIVLLDHKGETIRAHRGAGKCWCNLADADCDDKRVLIVADLNPDYAGTRELNAALRNRFAMQLSWDYDMNVEMALVQSSHLLTMAKQIRDAAASSGITTPVSTNMLVEFERIAQDVSVTFALSIFVNHFKPDERDPIRLVADVHRQDIEDDYKPKAPAPDPVDNNEQSSDIPAVDDIFDDTDFADFLFADDLN